MIFVTGDCHAKFFKLNAARFPQQRKMTKKDYLIICGDFGGIWGQLNDTVQQRTEKYWLRWLHEKPFTTLFVDGNHENFDRLDAMPVSEWHGGRVHKVWESVYHLMRGEVYDIDGKKFFTFGGASSHDISDGIIDGNDPDWKRQSILLEAQDKYMYRVKGVSWWEQELPTEAEMQHGLENLAKHGNQVDYIITHCAPTSVQSRISDEYPSDRLTDYLDLVHEQVSYRKWFFGHYHANYPVTKDDILLYEDIVDISTGMCLHFS